MKEMKRKIRQSTAGKNKRKGKEDAVKIKKIDTHKKRERF